MTNSLPPALTPEEWAETSCTRRYGPKLNQVFVLAMDSVTGKDVYLSVSDEGACEGIGITREAYHATAALCLYDHPYGFTRDDVRAVYLAWESARRFTAGHLITDQDRAHVKSLASLSDRILALLPPE